ncbi:MAG: EF-hand domain-containing protein [Alphaproteobacteria bacterium]
MKIQRTRLHTDLLAALVGVGILVTAPVMAESHGADGKMCKHMKHHMKHHGTKKMLKHFDEIDADSDGKITQDEVKAHHAARRAAADKDGDGKLSKAEFLAKAQKKAERKFARMDKNDDGFISSDEKRKRHHGKHDYFAKLDKDGDGALTKAEIEAHKGKHKGHHGDKSGGDR